MASTVTELSKLSPIRVIRAGTIMQLTYSMKKEF